MRRVADFRIDSFELVGSRLRVDGALSRIGIQEYSDGFGGVRREYRDPAEVFSGDSLASFRGMPVTIYHPPERVTPENWKDYTVGHVGDDPRQADDGQHVMASVWLLDAEAIKQVRDGVLIELSVGYTATLDKTPGISPEGERYDARQTEIRGNHVALLQSGQARGGRSVRLCLDQAGDVVLEGDSMGMKFVIRADGLSFDVTAENDNVLRALDKERMAAEQAKVSAEARADAAEEKVAKLELELEAAQIERNRVQHSVLKADALKIAPKLSIQDSDTPEQIRRNALEEIGHSMEGRTDDYICARFDIALEELVAKPEPKPEFIKEIQKSNLVPIFSLDAAAKALR